MKTSSDIEILPACAADAVKIAELSRDLIETGLGWLVASAQIAGLDRITVEVRADNTKARAHYAVLGFTFKRRLKGYYAGREDALQLVHLLMNPEIAASRPC